MNFIYKVPGYMLLLFGGFCLSWGGLIIRQFEQASVWEILLLRSIFFVIALILFLFFTYKSKALKVIQESGFPAVLNCPPKNNCAPLPWVLPPPTPQSFNVPTSEVIVPGVCAIVG